MESSRRMRAGDSTIVIVRCVPKPSVLRKPSSRKTPMPHETARSSRVERVSTSRAEAAMSALATENVGLPTPSFARRPSAPSTR